MRALDLFRDSVPVWNLFSDLEGEVDRWFGRLDRGGGPWIQPACDIEERDDVYVLSFDLPGITKNDVHVEVKDNVLTISGERQKGESSSKCRSERFYGRFQRSFTLPVDVDMEGIEANFEDGVLKVALPRSEKVKARSIPVEISGGGLFSRLIGKKDGDTEKGN